MQVRATGGIPDRSYIKELEPARFCQFLAQLLADTLQPRLLRLRAVERSAARIATDNFHDLIDLPVAVTAVHRITHAAVEVAPQQV